MAQEKQNTEGTMEKRVFFSMVRTFERLPNFIGTIFSREKKQDT